MSRHETTPIALLVETDEFVIGYLPGRGKRLVVSLSGVGRDFEQMPEFDFIAASSQDGENHVLFVADNTRSWMNSTRLTNTLTAEIERLVTEKNIEEVAAIGNSMGAFMALVLPRLTRVDCVLAFAAQYSMDRKIVPEDGRWFRWRKRLPALVHRTAEPQGSDRTAYFLFHGDHRLERSHWARFPLDRHVHHFIFQGQNHAVARALKEAGLLDQVVRYALERRPRVLRRTLEQKFDVIRRERLPAAAQTDPGFAPMTEGDPR